MRQQETKVKDTRRDILKISRQIQSLSETNCQRASGDSYEAHNRKRKLRAALDNSVRSLNTAKRIVESEPLVQTLTPVLSKQSLRKLVLLGKSLGELTEYFGVSEKSILTSMRIFGISFPKKSKARAD